MKVILLENLRRIGSIGEIIDVKRGFARNFLISNKKALYASKENIAEVEKHDGEIVQTEEWGLLNLSYIIKKNKKGSYIHFKIKGSGKIIDELEKNESIDKNLLRYMTVKVKKFDLEAKYFSRKDEYEKKEYKKDNRY